MAGYCYLAEEESSRMMASGERRSGAGLLSEEDVVEFESLEDVWARTRKAKKNWSNSVVMLEGYVDGWEQGSDEGSEAGRTKSLTDDDLEELKGCLDLGFGFSYEDIPELCNTLPALELCYSMSHMSMDEQQQSRLPEPPRVTSSLSGYSPIANWKISGPGDHPEEVKARLKYWAQAVACTVRLCS